VAAGEGPNDNTSLSTGVMLALAFPERVARNRGNGSFVLANGRGAAIDQTSVLARASYIAVAELTGTAAQGRILLAVPITQDDIELHFADRIETADEISFDLKRVGVAGTPQENIACDHLVGSAIGAATLGGDRTRVGRWPDRLGPRQAAMVEILKTVARPRHVPACR